MSSVSNILKNTKIYTILFLLILNFFVWNAVFGNEDRGLLKVSFLDVGQGDSIFIEVPNGNQVLIDGGLDERVLREISKILPFNDRDIDIVIATHLDADHIGGLVSVFEAYDISAFVESGVNCDKSVCDALKKAVEKENSKRILAKRGMVFDLGSEIYLKILFPDRDVSELESNSASVVAQLIHGEIEFLLMGDSPKKIEEYLISLNEEELESDVLKLGHHGSKTSSSEIFVGFVSPKYGIISAGKDNRYGHPNREVLDVLNKFEIKPLGTYDLGTITFESDGEVLELLKY